MGSYSFFIKGFYIPINCTCLYTCSIFLCDTMRMSSYFMLPESCGGLASLVFFTNSSYSLPFS